jgi:hypothetical protein
LNLGAFMKTQIVLLGIFSSISAFAQVIPEGSINHKTCNIWVPTWKPQGYESGAGRSELQDILSQKGYHVRFGVTRVADSDNELFLDIKENSLRNATWLRRGLAEVNFNLQDLGTRQTVYEDQTSVECNFKYSSDVSAYKDYTSTCQSKLTERAQALPECIISLEP